MRYINVLSRRGRFSPCGAGSTLIALSIAVLSVFLILPSPPVQSDTAGDPVPFRIFLAADGMQWEFVGSGRTVGEILRETGTALGESDVVYPSADTPAFPDMKIRVVRVMEKTVVQREPIPFATVTKFDYSRTDRPRTVAEGRTGEKEIRYVVVYRDGVKAGCRVVESRVLSQPVKEVVTIPRNISRQMLLASRSGRYTRSIRMTATAYDPGPRSCGASADGITASGMKAGHGVVAVDPRVIRLGTKLYVEGYGLCVAGDTGGAIKGARIDLGFNTYSQAIRFGRRAVTVYILD